MRLFVICAFLFLPVVSYSAEKSYVLSDEEYTVAYDVLSQTTDYASFITSQIQHKIAQDEIKKGSFLEIGCGPGKITRALMPYFSKTTIVEPNPKFAEAFLQEDCSVHQMIFEDFVTDERFDFILCSHVFYHIPRNQWRQVIQKMMNYLTPSGSLVIVMESPNSGSDLFRRRFNEDYLGSVLQEAPPELSKRAEVIYSTHFYQSTKRSDIFTLCRFLVLENCFTPSTYLALSNEEKMAIGIDIGAFVDSSKCADGVFRIDWNQELIFFSRS